MRKIYLGGRHENVVEVRCNINTKTSSPVHGLETENALNLITENRVVKEARMRATSMKSSMLSNDHEMKDFCCVQESSLGGFLS